eukprot:1710128-Prymnesium_polylepis.2
MGRVAVVIMWQPARLLWPAFARRFELSKYCAEEPKPRSIAPSLIRWPAYAVLSASSGRPRIAKVSSTLMA